MHGRERYFNWFIVAEFLASAALNDSKWALRSKLSSTMLAMSRGKTVEPLRPLTLENKALYGYLYKQINENFHKLERGYRDCIKRTRDKTRIYSIPHDVMTKQESMASLNP